MLPLDFLVTKRTYSEIQENKLWETTPPAVQKKYVYQDYNSGVSS